MLSKRLLADLIPRSATGGARYRSYQGVDDKPCREDDDESDEDRREDVVGTLDFLCTSHRRQMLESRPGKQYRGKEYSDIDAVVEDVLCKLREVADGLAAAGHIAVNRNNRLKADRSRNDRRGNKEGRHDHRK